MYAYTAYIYKCVYMHTNSFTNYKHMHVNIYMYMYVYLSDLCIYVCIHIDKGACIYALGIIYTNLHVYVCRLCSVSQMAGGVKLSPGRAVNPSDSSSALAPLRGQR